MSAAPVAVPGLEIWTATGNQAGQAGPLAARAERHGFDGVSFGDTQCLSADPFVGLGVAAGSTECIRLGVRVTNPVTRHPATVAAAIATVQAESGGRAVLGVGRGDSSLAELGLPAPGARHLTQFLVHLQAYLSAGEAEIDGHRSALRWLGPLDLPKVPVDVAATGPAVIRAGARYADQVTFNVGADPERLRAAIALARQTAHDAGRPPDELSLGAYVNVVTHPDPSVAMQMIKGPLAAYAHFSGMPEFPLDSLPPEDRNVVTAVTASYDSSRHARSGAPHVDHLDDAFVERFGVVGSPERCVERLAALTRLGIERFVIVGPAPDSAADEADAARTLLSTTVLPELRRLAGPR